MWCYFDNYRVCRIDKVLLKGLAYRYSDDGAMLPALNIPRTLLITTTQSPTVIYQHFIKDTLISFVLNAVGINGVEWINCEQTAHGTHENRAEFLKMVISKGTITLLAQHSV